jgi:dipeptidyl aminopeptidase/acylaminoacyl peptidase
MRRWILAGVAVIVWLATASSATAAYPGHNGRIAFYRADGHIYTIRPGGTGLRKLGFGTLPAYSPDGKRIAFVYRDDVWTMNSDGTNRQRVTTSAANDSAPTWSPDGTKIAFASDRNGGGLFTLNSTAPYGTARRAVQTPVDIPTFDDAPAWATNGFIYFTRYADGGSFCDASQDTMRVNLVTGTVRRILINAVNADPGPASHALVYDHAYVSADCQNFFEGISVANIDGSNLHAVTPPRAAPPTDQQPVFSPSSTKTAFQRGSYIYTVSPSGANLHRVTLGQAPSWQSTA